MQERMEELYNEMDRQLDNERLIIRSECLEELRGEREIELIKKLRDKLSKKIEQELYEQLPREIEGRVREDIMHKVMKEIAFNNEKQIEQLKRKISMKG